MLGWLTEKVGALTKADPSGIEPEALLTSLGMSSLKLVKLRAEITRRYGVAPSASADTLGEIAREVGDGEAGTDVSAPNVEIVPDAASRFEPFPLTDLQQAYLLGRTNAYELGSLGGHFSCELQPPGLDVERLEAAWARVVERHDALRITVLPDGRQQVAETAEPYRFKIIDLRDETAEGVEQELARLRERYSHRVFDLQRWPLFHIAAALLPGGEARAYFSIDLFVADLWALRVIMRDWWRFYDDPHGPADTLPLTFRDVVLADRARREAATDDDGPDAKYWARRVQELPPAPQLPAKVAEATTRFSRRTCRIAPERWEQVKQMAGERGVTPSGALLAAYSVVLGAWSASQRFTVDVTLFNRPPVHSRIEDLVGDFTDIDLVDVDLVSTSSFDELARSVQQRLWEDLEHEGAGGIRALRELGRHWQAPSTSALMPVVFTSALGGDDEGFASLFAGFGPPVHVLTQTPQLYLDHQVFEEHGEAVLVWDSRDGVLDETVLDAMFAAYQDFVARLAEPGGWAAPPDVPLPVDQAEVRDRVNNTAGPVPAGTLADRLLANAVDPEIADRPAVISPGGTLTFAELGARAVAIASGLRAAGLGPGDRVAVELPKEWRQIVAVLGATAAGCAYVPIDPELPAARREWIKEHAGVRAALTPESVDDAQPAAAEAVATWRCPAEPTDVAYVLYTSGSTGTPKGVEISHRAVLNTIIQVTERFGVGTQDRALGLSSLSFDLSLWDTFGVTAAGAALVLPGPDGKRDPAHWLELVREHRVTLWNSVPALLEMFVEHTEHRGPGEDLPLRLVLLSGDWIPPTLPDRLRALAGAAEVIGLGGPTETSVWTNAYPIGEVDPSWQSIPYGFPLRNHRLHVLNERLVPAPDLVPGEIYVGGTGLAEGYHNDPERTAAVFVRHPVTGERLYRSGDRAQFQPDGCLRILGRTDFQVKVGGHRIELGEVEHVLTGHDVIEQAVVVPVRIGDQHRLAGFLTRSGSGGGDPVVEGFGPVERDPMARLRFKLEQPGLRALDGSGVRLPSVPVPVARAASCRTFDSAELSADALATALSGLRSTAADGSPLPRRGYGSAGALYPVQVHAYVRDGRINGVPGGWYYYHPGENRLVPTGGTGDLPAGGFPVANRAPAGSAACVLFLVAQHRAIEPLYGRASRDFCLIESGLIAHSVESSAEAAGLGVCQLGATADDPALREALDLDEGHELLHTLVLGRPSDSGADGDADLLDDVRRWLAEQLPAYLVPSSLTVLEEMPLSARGKVDRAALVALAERAEAPVTYVAPADETERTIVEVIADVLGRERVGVHEHFLEIGADSVQLTRIYARLSERLPHGFSLITLFEHPNARQLAAALRGGSDEQDSVDTARARANRRRAARARRGGSASEES